MTIIKRLCDRLKKALSVEVEGDILEQLESLVGDALQRINGRSELSMLVGFYEQFVNQLVNNESTQTSISLEFLKDEALILKVS